MGLREWGLLAVLSLIWGGSFLFGRVAVAEVPPLTVAWLRVLLAAVTLVAVVAASGMLAQVPRTLIGWRPFAVMGLLNNVVPFSLILWGQQELGAGLASVLNATTPLFAAVVTHLFTEDEKLTGAKVTGILLGLAGVAVLANVPAAFSTAGGLAASASPLAYVAVLGAAASYGVAGLQGRRLKGTPPLVSACCQLICSSAILTVLASPGPRRCHPRRRSALSSGWRFCARRWPMCCSSPSLPGPAPPMSCW
jgi:drug/metabolite transporter (DMT)-like permease